MTMEREPSPKARQTAFNILERHPYALQDDCSMDDLIDDIAAAVDAATRGENVEEK